MEQSLSALIQPVFKQKVTFEERWKRTTHVDLNKQSVT